MDKRFEKTFLQRIYTHGHNPMKRCSTSLVIRDMRTQTTMRYYFTTTRMAEINDRQ